MRRKWVILLALVLSGVAALVILGYETKAYDLGEVHRAIMDFKSDGSEVNVVMDGENCVDPKSGKPSYFRTLKQWFPDALGGSIKGGTGFNELNELAEYVDNYRIRYPSGDVVVVVHWTFEFVEKIGKIGRVSRVEVRPDDSSGSEADRVRSELRKRFSGLRCTIVKTS